MPCAFSPRARGCSPMDYLIVQLPYVFPACAGMFPNPEILLSAHDSFPRVRGDVP